MSERVDLGSCPKCGAPAQFVGQDTVRYVHHPDCHPASETPPQPGEEIVLLVVGKEHGERTGSVLLVKMGFNGLPGEHLVIVGRDPLIVQRGPDGRWWSYGALQEYEDRTDPGAMTRRRAVEDSADEAEGDLRNGRSYRTNSPTETQALLDEWKEEGA